jgi:uncharacterized protein (UPF0218 family)
MAIAYSVTPELQAKFKRPFGTLIRGTFSETMRELEIIITSEKPPKIISVGDTVSRNLHAHKVNPQLSITDNKCMRRKVKPVVLETNSIVHVKNPHGTITEEALAAVQKALESDKQVHIIVNGEEDLLTLIAVLDAPEKSLVVYGQPHEGIVVVKVTPEKKAEAMEILKAMKTARKAK